MAFYNDIAYGTRISTEFFTGGRSVFLNGVRLDDPPEPLLNTRCLPGIFAGIGNATDFIIIGNNANQYRHLGFQGVGNQPIGMIISPTGDFVLAVSQGVSIRVLRVHPHNLAFDFMFDMPISLTSQGIRDMEYIGSNLIIHLTDQQRTKEVDGVIYHLWMTRGQYTVGQVDNKGVWAYDASNRTHYNVSSLETWTAPRIDITGPEPIVAIPSGNILFVPRSQWIPVDEPEPIPIPELKKPEVTVDKWDLSELKDGREFIFHDRENPELNYRSRVYIENGSMHAEITNRVGSGRTGARREVKPC